MIDPQGTRDPAVIGQANFAALINDSLAKLFPEATSRQDRRMVRGFVSSGAPTQLRRMVLDDPSLIGQTREVWVVADDEVDQYAKGAIDRDAAEADRRMNDQALGLLDGLRGGRPARDPLQPHLLHHAATRASPSSPASTAPCGGPPI